MIWGGAVVIIIEMKCPINAMHLNHPETIPLSLTLFCKKSVFCEIGPWCQKGWGPTALKDICKWQMMSDVFIFHSWPTHCRASSTSDSHLQNTSQIPSNGNTKINPKFLKCFLVILFLLRNAKLTNGWSPIYDSINITSMEATGT